MKITLNSREYDLAPPIDISIPLRFDGPQPNAYGVGPATARACESGTLVGDTRRGGSCNFEQYTFTPHCNGTHTECVGHILDQRIAVRDCLQDALIPARLVSVVPEGTDGHLLIARKSLEAAAMSGPRAAAASFSEHGDVRALVVRTLPNDESKLTRSYGEMNIPPYFSIDAMQYIVELGVDHLLVDLPSIDRIFDEGKLLNHRTFWNVAEGSFEVRPGTKIERTITELIYVPDEVPDGEYLLNLQIAPFMSDCAPSRPILFGAST